MGYLRHLAEEGGIDAPDEELRRADRKRKKKVSNEDWVHPRDADAEVTEMKDGSRHFTYKAEQAVDLDPGAIVANPQAVVIWLSHAWVYPSSG